MSVGGPIALKACQDDIASLQADVTRFYDPSRHFQNFYEVATDTAGTNQSPYTHISSMDKFRTALLVRIGYTRLVAFNPIVVLIIFFALPKSHHW